MIPERRKRMRTSRIQAWYQNSEKHLILALNRLIFERKSVLQASDFFFFC